MGTKNNPGVHDCYSKAEPDEPMFILLGRDPTAAFVVSFWRELKKEMKRQGTSATSDEKLEEAWVCAVKMQEWAKKKGKDPEAVKRVLSTVLRAELAESETADFNRQKMERR